MAAVAFPDRTTYLLAVREIVVLTSRVVDRAVNIWARGKQPSRQLNRDIRSLADATNALAPAPLPIETAQPLEEDHLQPDDPASFMGIMIANNLLPRLFEGDSVSPLIPDIATHVDQLIDPDYWQLLEEPPFAELSRLRATLVDLRAVLAEQVQDVALRASGNRRLAIAADVARDRAKARMSVVADKLQHTLVENGFKAGAVHYETGDMNRWPSDDFLILVELPTIFDWHRNLEALASICKPPLEGQVGFFMAPVREGRIVASAGFHVINDVFPDHKSIRDWPDPPLPLLDEQLGDTVRRVLVGLNEASGIIASVHRTEMHPEEVAALESSLTRARDSLREIQQLADTHDNPLLREVQNDLQVCDQRVTDEVTALAHGHAANPSIAASILAGLNGNRDEVSDRQCGVAISCVEWDTEPENAWARVERVLDET